MAAPAYAPAPMIAAEPMREMSKPQGEAMQAAAARADAAAATQSMSSAATAKAESAQQPSSAAHAPIPTIEPAPTTATTKSQVAGASVSDDTRLSVEHWLQQIRLRLKLKDEAGARESLRLFQLAHPRYPLPDDLRDLPDLPVK